MKKLLIGLMVLGSFSAFADQASPVNECVKKIHEETYREAARQADLAVDPQVLVNSLEVFLDKVDAAAKKYCKSIRP
jgi:hypothetical protein